MKMDFQRPRYAVLSGVLFLLILSGCGQPRSASTTFSKTEVGCEGAAMAEQFMVRRFDGTTAVVQAESEDAFIKGYLTENLNEISLAEHDFHVHINDRVQASEDVQASGTTTVSADNWGPQRVDAGSLWSQNVRGDGVKVAVIDTGIDLTHPQLAAQIDVNTGETGADAQGHDKSFNGVDDDGNGFIDDVRGYNFVGDAPLSGDDNGHGTHVSGVIAAAHSDTVAMSASYVQGLAPKAKIIPLKFLAADGGGSLSDGVRAINYAVSRGAQVINASWGGPECSKILRDTISGLEAKNVIFVAASGNDHVDVDSQPEYPAALNLGAQITVGAVGDHDDMAFYSNWGVKAVHIFAPGTNIVSTWPGGKMAYDTGTSMATPFVTGAVALLRGAVPAATVAQIRSALYSSASHRSGYWNASQGRMSLTTALRDLQQSTAH